MGTGQHLPVNNSIELWNNFIVYLNNYDKCDRFGGNPVSVCVFGNVEYLLLSNGAKGLFHSAIISPSSTSSVFSPQLKTNKNHSNRKDDAKKLFRMVAQEVGCGMSVSNNSENYHASLLCLTYEFIKLYTRMKIKLLNAYDWWKRIP